MFFFLNRAGGKHKIKAVTDGGWERKVKRLEQVPEVSACSLDHLEWGRGRVIEKILMHRNSGTMKLESLGVSLDLGQVISIIR